MKNIFKCSPKRFVKFILVCMSVIGLVLYFPRNHKPSSNLYKARPLDYINPDVHDLRRDPRLVNFTPEPSMSFEPTKYTKLQTIRFNHTCKARLKVGGSDAPICVYGKNLDNMVSSYVIDHGTWEKEQLEIMELILKQNKNMQVVDIGCNIGIYTLFATKMGRKVIAVDPLESNLQLLQKSLTLGKYLDKVTLVHNAISDHPEKVTIDLRVGNMGGTHVNPQPNPFKPHKRVKRYKRLVNKSRQKQNARNAAAQHSKSKLKNVPQKRSTKSKDPRKSFQFKIPNLTKRPNQQVQKIHQGNKISSKKTPKPNLPQIIKPLKTNDHDINKLLPGKRIGPNLSDPKPIAARKRDPAIKPLNAHDMKKSPATLKPGKGNSSHFKPDNSGVLKQDRSLVQAVTMDDLVKLGSFRPTFLKMDIEGWEYLALRGASIFLREFDVRYIMMEWAHLRRSSNGSKVVSYLTNNGFLPYKNNKKDEFLNVQNPGAWPDNVLWRKR